jgi:hypothetical protein
MQKLQDEQNCRVRIRSELMLSQQIMMQVKEKGTED